MQYNSKGNFRQQNNVDNLNNPILWIGIGIALLLLGIFTHKKVFAFAGIAFLVAAIFSGGVDFNNIFSRFRGDGGDSRQSVENYRKKMQAKEEKAKIKNQYKINQRQRKRAFKEEEELYQEQRERRLEKVSGIDNGSLENYSQSANEPFSETEQPLFDSSDFVYDTADLHSALNKSSKKPESYSSKTQEKSKEPETMDVFSTSQNADSKDTAPNPKNRYLFIKVGGKEVSLCNKEILKYMLNTGKHCKLSDRDVTRVIGDIIYNDYLVEHMETLIPKALVQAIGATSDAIFFFLCTNKQYRISVKTGNPSDAKEIADIISRELFNRDAISGQKQLATQGKRMENAYQALLSQIQHQTLDSYELLIKSQEENKQCD